MNKSSKRIRIFYIYGNKEFIYPYLLQNEGFSFKEKLRLINLTLETSGTFRCQVKFVKGNRKAEDLAVLFPTDNITVTVLGNTLFL